MTYTQTKTDASTRVYGVPHPMTLAHPHLILCLIHHAAQTMTYTQTRTETDTMTYAQTQTDTETMTQTETETETMSMTQTQPQTETYIYGVPLLMTSAHPPVALDLRRPHIPLTRQLLRVPKPRLIKLSRLIHDTRVIE